MNDYLITLAECFHQCKEDDLPKIASMYFNGSNGAPVNHRIAHKLYSQYQAKKTKEFYEDNDAVLCLGLYYYKQNDKSHTLELFEHNTECYSKINKDILLDLAFTAYENKQYSTARSLIKRFLSRTPQNLSQDNYKCIINLYLSSKYRMEERNANQTLLDIVRLKKSLSSENIELFCRQIFNKFSGKTWVIDQDFAVILERIFNSDFDNTSIRKKIAKILSLYYLNAGQWSLASKWAMHSEDKTLVDKILKLNKSIGDKHQFYSIVKGHLATGSLVFLFLIPIFLAKENIISIIYTYIALATLFISSLLCCFIPIKKFLSEKINLFYLFSKTILIYIVPSALLGCIHVLTLSKRNTLYLFLVAFPLEYFFILIYLPTLKTCLHNIKSIIVNYK